MIVGTPQERIVAMRLLDPLEEILQTPVQERIMRTVTNEGTFFPRFSRDKASIAFTEDVWASLAMREYFTTRDGAWRDWAEYYQGIANDLMRQEWLGRIVEYLSKAVPLQENCTSLQQVIEAQHNRSFLESLLWMHEPAYQIFRMFESYNPPLHPLLDSSTADTAGSPVGLVQPGGGDTARMDEFNIELFLDRPGFD